MSEFYFFPGQTFGKYTLVRPQNNAAVPAWVCELDYDGNLYVVTERRLRELV